MEPTTLDRAWPNAIRRICELRKQGVSYDDIAKQLAREQFVTPKGLTVWGVGQVWQYETRDPATGKKKGKLQ